MTTLLDVTPPDLTRLPGCSRDDLVENSAGRLSPAQKQSFYRGFRRRAAGFAFGIVILAIWIGHSGLGLFSGLALLAVVWNTVKFLENVGHVSKARVESQVGDAWTELVPDSDGPDSYFVHVGGVKLETKKEFFEAITPGGPYRVYYVPGAKTAVSATPEPGWRPIERPAVAKPKRRWSLTLWGD